MLDTLGKRLTELRERRGYTIDQVLDLTKNYQDNGRPKSKMWLWRLEKDNLKRYKANDIDMLAKIYGVTPEYIIDGKSANVDTKFLDLLSNEVVDYIKNPENHKKVEQSVKNLMKIENIITEEQNGID